MRNIPLALTFDDVLLVPQRSPIESRSKIDLSTKITNTFSINFPVITINMDSVTGIKMAVAMSHYGAISFYPRFKKPAEQLQEVRSIIERGERVIPAIGIKPGELERVKVLYDGGIRIMTIDIAHGHLDTNINFIKKIKGEYQDLEVIAGVIGTYQGARDLFEAGADAVRVGVGPGTICTTRAVAGSGVPQITAIMEAKRAGDEFGRPILADGGTKTTGDIVKALAAGANAVVMGNQLAGCEETPGEVHEINGQKYKSYNASTSKTEKIRQYKNYSKDKSKVFVEYVEGVESYVPYKGPVKGVLDKMDKGIRSGLSYSGAKNIADLHKRAQFIRITSASIGENGAHGVMVNGN